MSDKPRSAVDGLLQRVQPHSPRRLSAREVRMEVVSGLLLGAAIAAMAVGFDGGPAVSLLDLAGLIVLHAVCSHVRVYVGGGYGMPTQLALVPMLFLLPPALVPVAVAAGLCCATGADVVRGREHPDRLLSSVGDAWHAVGPALVMAIAHSPGPGADAWILLMPAVAAEALTDTVTASLREWVGRGIPPSLQLRVMVWVYSVDLLLTPIAALAVAAPVAGGRGWIFLAPLVALLAGLVADRQRRVEHELERVEELGNERARLRAVMRRVGAALAANLDRDAMLLAVLETASEALDASTSSIHAGPEPGPHAGDSAIVLWHAAREAAAADGTVSAATGSWHAIACRLGRDGAHGTLAVARPAAAFTVEEAEILHHLAAHAGVSLENTELHARLREQATIDELTGLANHRALQHVLAEQLDGMSLVLLDIDDFKRVNDTHGHQEGDRILREVARTIRSHCRSVDSPARYGGEELAVALPRTDADGAMVIAEELRRAVQDMTPVTVSVGVASAPHDGATPEALVAAADRALYAAKRSGKNRTMAALGDGGGRFVAG